MIAIIGAMAEEVAAFKNELIEDKTTTIAGIEFHVGKIGDVDVVLAQSGIGKVNAAMTTTLICQYFQPKSIINTGSAGGFNHKQAVGDLVVSIDVLHHDVDVTAFGYTAGQVPGMPATFAAEHALIDIAHNTLVSLALTAHRGQIGSGDKFMTKTEHIQETRTTFPLCDAVEMEGAAIAQVCHRFAIPFVIVRALSDIAGQESPMSFEQFLPLAAANAAKLIVAMLPQVAAKGLG
jgi:adenosylhomocysteine nucleosidase